MNSQRAVTASEINKNTAYGAISVTLDHRMNFYALDAYLLRCTQCIAIFGRIPRVQTATVHLIIFYPRVYNSLE